MTTAETLYLAAFMRRLSERLSNDGCNDLYLPDTGENRKFVQAVLEFQEDDTDTDVKTVQNKGVKQIITNNVSVVDYLASKFMEDHDLEDEDLPEIT